ncbi:hypothetical protein HYD68_00705 [Mycoplasmopsis bovis]|nr:hypothetical protein [Mycoplasmopsis bovis]QQH54520.1 hypothetical protein HYD68_00705 [Mycoplasmopsis bovis]
MFQNEQIKKKKVRTSAKKKIIDNHKTRDEIIKKDEKDNEDNHKGKEWIENMKMPNITKD